jgi:hypothetical protein
MSVIRTADWANVTTPYWVNAVTGLATTPDIQVSTLQVNQTGRIVLQSDPIIANCNAVIAFTSPSNTGLLSYTRNTQVNAAGTVSQKYQITSLDSTGLSYDDLASESLVLYGNNVVGGLPIASFKEYLDLNYLNIISPGVVTENMYLSTLNVVSNVNRYYLLYVNSVKYSYQGDGVTTIIDILNILINLAGLPSFTTVIEPGDKVDKFVYISLKTDCSITDIYSQVQIISTGVLSAKYEFNLIDGGICEKKNCLSEDNINIIINKIMELCDICDCQLNK